MALSKTTQDHDEIKTWAEARGARPAEVASTESGGEAGIIRLEFPDAPHANDGSLKEISWDDFFEKFDKSGLALIYQEQTADGERSNFNRFAYPENLKESAKPTPPKNARKTPSKTAPASKSSAKKAPAKSAARKSSGGSTAAAKRASAKAAKKSTPAKSAAKKAPAKKAPAKKTPAKKAPAKKTPARKAPAKKAPAKKSAGRKSSR